VAESVLCCTSPSSNLRQNPEIRAGRVVRWWASSTPTYATQRLLMETISVRSVGLKPKKGQDKP